MPEPRNEISYASVAVDTTLTAIGSEVVVVTVAKTITLPVATTCYPGQRIRIINNISGNGVVTIAPGASDTINGVAGSDVRMNMRYTALSLITDGVSAWFTVDQVGGPSLPPQYQVVSAFPSMTASGPIWVAPNDGTTWKLKAASARFTTTSTSGTLNIEHALTTVAPGSGTAQLTGTVSLAGTANVTVNGTVSATPTTIAAGSALNAVLAGTLTNLAGLHVTLVLERLT